jgi:predicted transport protein
MAGGMMALFKIAKKLEAIKEKPFKLEKEIQSLTEENLDSVLRLEFVKSEFKINNFRIDTLAFDNESKAFVIIEYKRDKNFSVIDQGYAYLSLMLNNKADFILEYNESKQQTLKRNDVDWSQSRVLFISPGFTTYQREAINFKDLPIELWEIKRFTNNTVSYTQIQKSNVQESIKTISKNDKSVQKIAKEIKVYTEQEHLDFASEEIKDLYEKFRSAILNLGDIEVKPRKLYIAFVAGTNVVDIEIQKKAIKLLLNMRKGELSDPENIMKDVSNKGHWGNGDYRVVVNSDDDLEYILSLIKQSLKKNGK